MPEKVMQPMDAIQKQATEDKKKNSWDDTLKTIIYAVVLALLFRSFLYEPFHIPSGSMKSNLLVGDYLFVSKFSYGYSRYSFPLGLPPFEGRIFASKPQRGDVIVFRYPKNPRVDYIKRLVGMPGDAIQMKDGRVYINGTMLDRHYVDQYLDEGDERFDRKPYEIARFEETLPEGRKITILKEKDYYAGDDTPVMVVPPGHYFFLGDNRDNSRDSRFMDEVGFVPEQNLVGRAELIFCSVEGGGSCFNPLNWFGQMRLDRFLTVIR
ncbi:MAG: signal peptidase I [Alphaproteobacteria bacterium]|nr:signal peptidase I [Alphaproteobacteria bacterium]